MHEYIEIIVKTVWDMWYLGIFLMMVIESSFIPFPSELAMIPAWFLAFKWELDFWFALLIWTFWAIIWASINYFLAYFLWEKIILKLIKKYWKYFFIKEEHYQKSENYFVNHWSITIFLARFIPAVRQLISLPAWAFKMNYKKFFIYTWVWAWIWNLILMTIWYIAGQNQELIKQYTNKTLLIILLLSIILIYWYTKFNINKKNSK
jgi:membrane protein DedA with SNARE-associated domain